MSNRLQIRDCELRVSGSSLKPTTRNPQSQMTAPKSVRGFTLLEVIIAITIGSVIIMVSTAALRIGLSHMQNGEEWLNGIVKDTSAYDFFWQQVTSIRSIELPEPEHSSRRLNEEDDSDETESEKVFFKGGIDSMSFITPLSLKRHYGYGLIIATYKFEESYEGIDLVYTEKRLNPAVLSSMSDGIIDTDEDAEEIVIFSECEDIKFEYLEQVESSDQTDNETLSSFRSEASNKKWVVTLENKLPIAIKIIIVKEEKEKELVGPVMVMYSL